MKTEEILAELKAAKERIEFLEQELNKPKAFEFKYKKGDTYFIRHMTIGKEFDGEDKSHLDAGLYRITKDNAKEALKLNRESNIIGAIAEQIDPNYASKLTSFSGRDRSNFIVFYDYSTNSYVVGYNYEWRALGAVYMPKDVAYKVCDILNNKEVEL